MDVIFSGMDGKSLNYIFLLFGYESDSKNIKRDHLKYKDITELYCNSLMNEKCMIGVWE